MPYDDYDPPADTDIPQRAPDDPDFPPAQQCDDTFDQDGMASRKVRDCQNLDPAVVRRLISEAIADADTKARWRCPNICPPELVQPLRNAQVCENNTLTITVTRRYRCRRQAQPPKETPPAAY